MKTRKIGLTIALLLFTAGTCFAQGFYSYPSKSNTSAATGAFTTSVTIPEKTPVNAVASQGTITMAGIADVETAAQGTITMAGIATVEVASQGTITMAGIATVEVASQGTITMAGIAVAEETFVVSTQTFTWVASRSQLGECSIGTNAGEAVTNIVEAITADLSDVTAVDGEGDTVVITAATAGAAGDLIPLTEDSTNMTVDGTGTLGATTAGVDADTFVVDDQTFTWVTTRAGAGEVTVGADAPAAVTNVVTAITADLATVTAVDGEGDTVVVTAATAGTAGDLIVFTEDSTNMTVDGAGTLGTTTAGVDADTFVIDTQTFTWKSSRTGTGDVAVGASASEAVTNIVTAVAADLTSVTAVDGDGDTVVLTAATAGTAGNAIILTEDSANMTVDGTGTLGATTAGLDEDTFVIDDQTFTWKSSRVGTGDVAVGASASEAVTNIVTAVTADLATVTAVDGEGDTVVLTAATKGVAGDAIVLTEDSANMTVDGSGTLGTTTAGVDGTVGIKNEIACDGTYFYICIDTNTISDANWKRMTVGDSY